MVKKTVKYTDVDGNEVEEELMFHLTKAEITEINASYPGGMKDYARSLIKKHDEAAILALFKEIILRAYGERSTDGKNKFIKRRDGHLLAEDFIDGEAYSALFEELLTSEENAQSFFEGLVPNANK